ncbi:hypothetical protein BG004_006905 [Podila humilis]|nr:hypothetical protein BG004_006905 [Podila humilis]
MHVAKSNFQLLDIFLTDTTAQDDASFTSLVQEIKLSTDPDLVEDQISFHIQCLESIKTQLENTTGTSSNQGLWDEAANTLQFFADAARQEKTRTPLGESAVVPLIVGLETLNSQRLAHVDIQAMRAFANICVDHDVNRMKLLEADAFDIIVTVLAKSTNADAIKTASGALLNTTMSCEPAQKKVITLGAIEHLLKVLHATDIDENEVSMTIASRVIANLSDIDTGAQSAVKNGCTKTVIQLLQRLSPNIDSYLDLMDAAADIMRAVASRESAQIAIQNEGSLNPLLDILQHAGTSDEGKTKEEKEEDDKKLGEIKAALVELVVSVTMADPNMVPIFNDKAIMERFLSWLDMVDREDLQTTAALCLGNVARSEQHCVKLVHDNQAVEPLIHIVRKAVDLKASHAATGVLRNLALPERNREALGNAGVIQACFPLLKKDNALPLQSNIVGILKRLSTSDGHNAIRIISGREPFETLSSTPDADVETPLSTLVELIERTDDFGLKSEGNRTLCNLIKVAWGSEIVKEFDTASVAALQQTLNRTDVVLSIAAMTRNPKFVVLQSEGLVALTLLVTSPSQDENAVLDSLVSASVTAQPDPETTISEEPLDTTKPLTLLESVLALIKNADGKTPDEIRTNACVFLRNALDSAARIGNDRQYTTYLKASSIKETLEHVVTSSELRPLVRNAVQEVISRL